jgi:hypothetical protein
VILYTLRQKQGYEEKLELANGQNNALKEKMRHEQGRLLHATSENRHLHNELDLLRHKLKRLEEEEAELEAVLAKVVEISDSQCEGCGNIFMDDAKFCRKCGEPKSGKVECEPCKMKDVMIAGLEARPPLPPLAPSLTPASGGLGRKNSKQRGTPCGRERMRR